MPRIVLKKSLLQKMKKKPVVAVAVKPRRSKRLPRNLRKLAFQVAKISLERNDSGWVASSETPVGQINGSVSNAIQPGHYANSLTPIPSQGDSQTQRTGDSITVTGMYNVFQFQQQSNALQGSRIKIIYAMPKFSSQESVVDGVSTYGIETLLNANPIIKAQSGVNVYDTTSTYNHDYNRNWKILRVVNRYIKPDLLSGQKTVTTIKAGLKFRNGHKVNFVPGTTNISEGDIRVFLLFENGNCGSAVVNGTVNSGLSTNAFGVPVKDASSGWLMCNFSKAYYLA